MDNHKVSVIVPASNSESEKIKKTVYSVLNQSYQNFEVIVAGNFSSHLIASFKNFIGSKLKFRHCKDEQDAVARNIGINAASGDLIFFLLPGDLFHPEKIQKHLKVRKDHPEVVMTYNPHFIIGKAGNVFFQTDTVTDWNFVNSIIELPITLSDVVVTKDWINEQGMFICDFGSKGSDIDFIYRLVLEDGKVIRVNQRLNYNLIAREFFLTDQDIEFEGMILALNKLFSDEQCPKELKRKQTTVMSKVYMNRALQSFFRGETLKGQEWIRKAIRLDRSILDSQAREFLRVLIINSLTYVDDFESNLRRVINQLPPELEWISKYLDQSVAKGYILSGISDVFWESEKAETKFKKALSYKIDVDLSFLIDILVQISYYQSEFGFKATKIVVNNIGKYLVKIGQLKKAYWFIGTYYINQAFSEYHNKKYAKVPSFVIHAITKQPLLFFNRGVLSIFCRSTLNNWKYKFKLAT